MNMFKTSLQNINVYEDCIMFCNILCMYKIAEYNCIENDIETYLFEYCDYENLIMQFCFLL